MQPGGSEDLSTLLFEKRPTIIVDASGGSFLSAADHPGPHILTVGTIERKADLSTETWSSGPPGITSLIPLLFLSEVEHELADLMASPESRPPSRLGIPPQSLPDRVQELITDGGSSNDIQESAINRRDRIPDMSSNSPHDSTRQGEVSND